MKHIQLFCFFLFTSLSIALAQPSNDECNAAIDLGVAGDCQTDSIYTNFGATASDIGASNSPTCFVGGLTNRDVWFSFTSTADISNYVISLEGVGNGPSGQGMQNPQITLYRGTCNGLAELQCTSSENGAAGLQLEVFNLVPDLTYYIRVNDYTATTIPNWGDFTLCVDELIPDIIMGETDFTEACSGTLFDSGGPEDRYNNNEDLTFTVCPQQANSCIQIDVQSFDIEFEFDVLTIYAGDGVTAPILARISGTGTGDAFPIQANSNCVTFRFQSDSNISRGGFEINWQCASASCAPTSLDDPVEVSLPFSGDFSTCDFPSSFGSSPCGNLLFLNGPEYVFSYESPGDECISVEVSDAAAGTGVLILDGLPTDADANCIAENESGIIRTANLEELGTYYIVVANVAVCTDFSINVESTDCALSPALVDNLCNPLNGCAGDEPSIFVFQDGFQDIEITDEVNAGCWLGFGDEPDFYWFTMEAQADGKFGFILESADASSDIDFNVWGPFTQGQVCDTPDEVVSFVENNQPIRSSWSPTAGKTGLADVHPVFGNSVLDEFDCGSPNTPNAEGDDFVRTIDAQQGEVYVVLINDWGNQIQSDGILVDWSPSDQNVLAMIDAEVVVGDTAICQGDSVQLEIGSGVNNVIWSPSETLSCDDCLNPVASPTETTVYTAIVEGICTSDTVEIEVQVFELDAGEDVTVCSGEEFVLEAGANFGANATYEWEVPDGLTFSCADCPNPTVTTDMEGVYTVTVNLDAPNCPLSDEVQITVLPQTAPEFEVQDSLEICVGESTALAFDDNPSTQDYSWTSEPPGFNSTEGNPTVSPTETTKYFVEVNNGTCPTPSLDSVLVTVFTKPEISTVGDTLGENEAIELCLGDSLRLGVNTVEANTEYLWTGPGDIVDVNDPNTSAVPRFSGLYVLTATRGACSEAASFEVDVTQISVEILRGDTTGAVSADTVRICKDDSVQLTTNVLPQGAIPQWFPNDGALSDTLAREVTLTPTERAIYYAQVTEGTCVRTDSILALVDSLPPDLSIMPMDTAVCEGSIVELRSTLYEPFEFPDIEFMWEPGDGQQSPDSLYNLVAQPVDTIEYRRITINGACIDTARAVINVQPIPTITVVPADTSVCPGETVDLLATSDEEIETWEWMPEQGLSATDQPNVTATALNDISYSVTGETENGCPGTGTATIDVQENPVVNITPAEPLICLGETANISAVIVPPGLEFGWTSPDDPDFVPTSSPNISVSPNSTSTYALSVVNGDCGVFETEVEVVVIQEAELPAIPDVTICRGENVDLTAAGTQQGEYVWQSNGITVGEGATINVSPGETTTYTVIYDTGCDTLMTDVTVNVVPDIIVESFTAFVADTVSTEAEEGDPIRLELLIENLSELGELTYSWTENGEALSETGSEITIVPQSTGNVSYEVTATTAEGCSILRTITITVIPAQVQFPNAFYPNSNEELNQTFRIFFAGNYTLESLKIYDRWGQVVFETSDITARWDGTNDGNELPSDVYVYVAVLINPRGQTETFRGEVLLIR